MACARRPQCRANRQSSHGTHPQLPLTVGAGRARRPGQPRGDAESAGASSRCTRWRTWAPSCCSSRRLLVSLALKVNSLVGIEQAPNSLALVAGVGALLAMFANPFFGKLSDRTSSRLGMRRPWMVIGLVGGFARRPRRRPGAQHRGRPASDGASPRCSSTRCSPPWSRCCPTRSRSTQRGMVSGVLGVCLPDRLGGRHLPGPAVHRQPARDVPGPVRDRRVLHPALRRSRWTTAGSTRRTSRLVAARARQHVLRQPAQEPGLRVGVRQPLHVRPGLRLPDHLPGVLPARAARQRRGRRAASRSSSARSSSPP